MKLLHVLEVDRTPDMHMVKDRLTDGEKGWTRGEVHVVKEYVRAGAGRTVPHPYDLRPTHVLMETMLYLIRYVYYVSCKLCDRLLLQQCVALCLV